MSALSDWLWGIISPQRCVCCRRFDTWLCPVCRASIVVSRKWKCFVCKKNSTPYGSACQDCRKCESLRNILPAVDYEENSLPAKLVHLYKYRFVSELDEVLGEFMVESIRASDLPLPDLIIPIPLHPRRQRWRGFNQAELLARHIAANLLPDLPLTVDNEVLVRHRYTKPQVANEDRVERLANLREAFAVVDPTRIDGKTVWLADDVATTGTTLTTAANTLYRAGATKIYSVVFARGR